MPYADSEHRFTQLHDRQVCPAWEHEHVFAVDILENTYIEHYKYTCALTGYTQSDTLSTHVNANSTSGLVQLLSLVRQDGDPLMGLP